MLKSVTQHDDSQAKEDAAAEAIFKFQYDLQVAINNVIGAHGNLAAEHDVSLQGLLYHIGSSCASCCHNLLPENMTCCTATDIHNELSDMLIQGFMEKVQLLLASNRDCNSLIVLGDKLRTVN